MAIRAMPGSLSLTIPHISKHSQASISPLAKAAPAGAALKVRCWGAFVRLGALARLGAVLFVEVCLGGVEGDAIVCLTCTAMARGPLLPT